MTLAEANELLKTGRFVRRPAWASYCYLFSRHGGVKQTLYYGDDHWAPKTADIDAADWEECHPKYPATGNYTGGARP